MGVEVLADDQVVARTTVSSGSPPCSINAQISGANTLELGVYEDTGEPFDVAFGEMRVVTGKDFPAMPSETPARSS
jgi:hypothetical protein